MPLLTILKTRYLDRALAAALLALPLAFASVQGAQAAQTYTLDSGDQVRIIVFGQDNLSNVYSVDGSGAVAMPLIGPVRARGLTTFELSSEIARKLLGRRPGDTVDLNDETLTISAIAPVDL